MYIVKEYFEDMLDEHKPYNVGDEYPRKGLSVDKERFLELSTDKNIRGVPLIEYRKSANAKKVKAKEKVE